MKNYFLLACTLLIACTFFNACSSDGAEEQTKQSAEKCIGTENFKASLKETLKQGSTRSIEGKTAMVPTIVELSRDYLAKNGISYTDFVNDPADPRIAAIALALAEYDIETNSISTRTTFFGCCLEAAGVKDLMSGTLKSVAKQIGKAVLKRAVPYVGWGLAAVSMAMCLAEK
jgi:hypothetical protein